MGNGATTACDSEKKIKHQKNQGDLKTHSSWGGNRHFETLFKPKRWLTLIRNIFQQKDLMVEHYLPPWCVMKPRLSHEIGEITRKTWESIVNGEAEGIRRMKQLHPEITALTYFYDKFYSQLFYLFPQVQRFFKSSIAHQGRRLVKSLMGLATMVCYEKEKVHAKLVWLAQKHNEAGIHPQFYGGFMWNILMTLRHCLGSDWTSDVEEAWVISTSYMLRVMVPVAVEGTKHFASPFSCPKFAPEDFQYERVNDTPKTISYTNDNDDISRNSYETPTCRSPKSQSFVFDNLDPLSGYTTPSSCGVEGKNEWNASRCYSLTNSMESIEEHFTEACLMVNDSTNSESKFCEALESSLSDKETKTKCKYQSMDKDNDSIIAS